MKTIGVLASVAFAATAMWVTAVPPVEEEQRLPVRGFCIGAPAPDGVDDFVSFIRDHLAPAGINTLVLRVDTRYEFTSRPELRAENALSRSDAG